MKFLPAIKGIPLACLSFVYYSFYRFIDKVTMDKFKKLSKKGKYIHPGYIQFMYFPAEKTKRKNKIVAGYFGSDKYFSEIRSILLKEMAVKIEPSEENKTMIEEINSCNSVCVHMRRGDFLVEKYAKSLAVCTEYYYQKGMDYIASNTENPVFYIFSNTHSDLEWIKNNYQFDYPVKYVDLNNPDYEEIRLMYNCKHFVISNSTFSWWGSYLSSSPNKIVVAPDIFKRKEPEEVFKDMNCNDVYRDDMVIIPTTEEKEDNR